MRRLAISAVLLCAVAVSSQAAPPVAKRSAWFYLTADGKQWCAVTSEAKARQAGKSDRFDGSETARIDYNNQGIILIVDAAQSADAFTGDHYTFDKQNRVKQVIRRGAYASQPSFSVTFVSVANGKLTLTAASHAVLKQQDRAQHETYFVHWPLYPNLATMPFSVLIQTKPTIAVTERCIKGPSRPPSDD